MGTIILHMTFFGRTDAMHDEESPCNATVYALSKCQPKVLPEATEADFTS